MGDVKKHQPVKLIVSLIFKEDAPRDTALRFLEKRFGTIDFASGALRFTHTDYYRREFGEPLQRTFLSFRKLITPENLYKIKLFTNHIEAKLLRDSRRLVNIDPGYLDLGKLVLATTKNYAHRIYLRNGIFAEVTLAYREKTFKALEWTYPDYRTPECIRIFSRIRDIYKNQIGHI